jgi:hypothetical protein
MLVAADQALLAAKALGGGAVIRASGLTATTRSGNTDQQNGPSATTGSSEVRFCGYCAHRPTRATNHRVCTKCGLGVLISASADVAPSSEEAFLILDEDMFVGALSEQMQLLIGASENSAIDRHIDNFLILTDAQDPVTEQLERALARAAHGDTTPRLAIQLRTSTGDTITLRARVGPCEPLPATLIVLTDTD